MNYRRKAITGMVGLTIIMALAGCGNTVFVLLRERICELHGYSDAMFAVIFSTTAAGALVGNMLLGKLIPKLGIKKLTIISSCGPIATCAALTFIENIYAVWVSGFVFGMLISFGFTVTFNVFISNWFNEGRGKMLSIGNIGMSGLGIIFSPLVATLISHLDTATSTIGIGVVMSAILLLASIFLVCELPSAYNAEPIDIGKGKAKEEKNTSQDQSHVYEPEMPMAMLLRIPRTILCIALPGILTIGTTILYTNTVLIFQDFGISYLAASYCMSILSISGVIWVAIFGVCSDKFGQKRTIVTFTAICSVAMFAALLLHGLAGAVFVAIFASMVRYANMLSGLLMPSIYGSKKSTELISYAGTLMGLAGVCAPAIGAPISAVTGSFRSLLPVLGVIYALALVLILVVMNDRTKMEIKERDQQYISRKQ